MQTSSPVLSASSATGTGVRATLNSGGTGSRDATSSMQDLPLDVTSASQIYPSAEQRGPVVTLRNEAVVGGVQKRSGDELPQGTDSLRGTAEKQGAFANQTEIGGEQFMASEKNSTSESPRNPVEGTTSNLSVGLQTNSDSQLKSGSKEEGAVGSPSGG
ncbi:MAG: hypothetical protein IT290_02165, partial [Deltaproteobacteria bacterium]|nr:hypothetical protein [Deltaproteobacteria bacterium]